jgi:hypothetical protein
MMDGGKAFIDDLSCDRGHLTMRFGCILSVALAVVLSQSHIARAAFHLMQIEQVIGGVNGDTTAQAIQLRMRSVGQNLVSSTKVEAIDATGANPVLLENMTTNVSSGAGRRILITTPNFANYTNIPLVSDFTMDPIPVSYLAAGQIRFMSDFGTTIYWSLSWGGSNYTGSTTGTFDNDSNGNFGPPVDMPLPSTTLQALQFNGAASAASTSNNLQYVLTAGAATFINNANTSFTLVAPEPEGLPGDYNDDGIVDAVDYTVWRNNLDTDFDLAGNGNEEGDSEGTVDAADYDHWKLHYGDVVDPPGAGGIVGSSFVPEPGAGALVVVLAGLTKPRRRRK